MEVRGGVNDRPWGITLGAIALRRHTGQLTELHRKLIESRNHFVTSTQVPDIARRLASAHDRDEIEVLAETIRFSPEQLAKLRHRVVAQRAARTFSLERGEFVLDDRITLPVVGGVAVDHRHVIYLGVRTNLSEQRLIDDLRQLGSFFVLKPEAVDELPRYGFDPSAEPVLDALKMGTSLPELEASNRDIDPRSAQAVIYALVSCTACVIPQRTGTAQARPTGGRRITQPIKSGIARTSTPEPATSRTTTERDRAASVAGSGAGSGTGSGTPPPPAASRTATAPAASRTAAAPAAPRTVTSPASARTATPPAAGRTSTPPAAGRAATPPATGRAGTPPATARAGTGGDPIEDEPRTGTLPPFAAGTVTFQNQAPTPAVARSTTTPFGTSRPTSSPFASRTNTTSPTSYSATAFPDEGTNTPAATRARAQSDPGSPRPTSATSSPAASRATTRSGTVIPSTSPGRTAARPPSPDAPLTAGRTETDEGMKFVILSPYQADRVRRCRPRPISARRPVRACAARGRPSAAA